MPTLGAYHIDQANRQQLKTWWPDQLVSSQTGSWWSLSGAWAGSTELLSSAGASVSSAAASLSSTELLNSAVASVSSAAASVSSAVASLRQISPEEAAAKVRDRDVRSLASDGARVLNAAARGPADVVSAAIDIADRRTDWHERVPDLALAASGAKAGSFLFGLPGMVVGAVMGYAGSSYLRSSSSSTGDQIADSTPSQGEQD